MVGEDTMARKEPASVAEETPPQAGFLWTATDVYLLED
jgi:hypothetical protein